MTFYYVTIFEEQGKYYPHFDLNEVGRDNGIEVGKRLGANPVYLGEIQDSEQGNVVNRVVAEANKTSKFDPKRLEEILE